MVSIHIIDAFLPLNRHTPTLLTHCIRLLLQLGIENKSYTRRSRSRERPHRDRGRDAGKCEKNRQTYQNMKCMS